MQGWVVAVVAAVAAAVAAVAVVAVSRRDNYGLGLSTHPYLGTGIDWEW